MTDDDFRRACNTFGFAPSRALRELLDSVTAQAVLAEGEACARVCETYETACIDQDALNTAKIFTHCAATIRARSQA